MAHLQPCKAKAGRRGGPLLVIADAIQVADLVNTKDPSKLLGLGNPQDPDRVPVGGNDC